MVRRIALPFKVKRPILACGADLKGSFAFAKGNEAIFIDGFGDLGDLDNFTRYSRAIKSYRKKLGIKLRIITCDLHPDYFSTRFAEDLQLKSYGLKLCRVQHHEAHIASAIVDNYIRGNVIGVAFDGTGYGADGNIWGGEFFVGGLKGFERAVHLEYFPMPGGERAIKQPWRMAVSYLYRAFRDKFPPLAKRWRRKDLALLVAMMDKGMNSPLTSSAGRLFDAAGSLILAKDFASKEAELPIELERIASNKINRDVTYLLSTKDMIRGIVGDIAWGLDKSVISAKFHNTIAARISKTALRLSKKSGIKQVVLSGGVFQNKFLTARSAERMHKNGLKVYTHSNVPAGDSGIPLGQIAIANARARCV